VHPVTRNQSPTRVADLRWPSARRRLKSIAVEAALPLFRPLTGALLLTLMMASAAANDIAAQGEKLQKLREQIHDIKSDVESMRGQRTATQAALEKAEKEIGNVVAELHQLEIDAAATDQKIQSLNRDRVSERQALAGLRQALRLDMQSAYSEGSQQRIKLLLNQQDPAMVGRMMTYHGFFSRARASRIQALRAMLARLDSIEHELVEQQAEIEQLRLQQREKSARLGIEQDKRRNLLAQLQRDLQARTTELSNLQQDEQQLQALIQSLQQALRDIPPESGDVTSLRQFKGKLRWPVAGKIIQPYGAQQASGELQSSGVVIATAAGTDVHAIANGRIVFADWLRGFGLLLIIDHGDGYMSLYGRNRSLYEDVGAWVKRGAVVAAAGSSGGRNQEGLYLELRKDGRPFNPTAWFSDQPLPLQTGRK